MPLPESITAGVTNTHPEDHEVINTFVNDFNITTPATGQLLRYNAATGHWENATDAISNANVSATAAIAENKLNLASDAAAGTPSRRSLGYTSTTAAPGDFTITVPGPMAVFHEDGEAVATGLSPIVCPAGGPWTFRRIRANLGIAPGGQNYIVDVLLDGVSIYATNADRPSIAPSSTTDIGGVRLVDTWAEGEVMTVDILQVGTSPNTGSALVVQVETEQVLHANGWTP